MKKYEYLTSDIPAGDIAEHAIHSLGLEGWRLVTTHPYWIDRAPDGPRDHFTQFIFVREIPDEAFPS